MLRDNLAGLIEPMLSSAGANPLALCTARKKPSDDRPQDPLKIPAPKGRNLTLTENAASPFHAEPRQLGLGAWRTCAGNRTAQNVLVYAMDRATKLGFRSTTAQQNGCTEGLGVATAC